MGLPEETPKRDPISESYIKQTPEQLVAELTLVTTAPAATLTALGITKDESDAAAVALAATRAAIQAKSAAVAQVSQASQAKLAAKRLAVASLNAMVKTAQASAAPDAVLVAVGFPPRRSGTSRPAIPQQVTDVKAAPVADGSVRVSWARSGNSPRATFTIEASADGREWTIVAATPRVSLTLVDFAPGVTTWFRVTATNAGRAARPSEAVPIYLLASAVQLRLAA